MIRGLIAPILSPFNEDLSFDQVTYNDYAKHLLASGCSGLAPFGTTGEAMSISTAERQLALEGLVGSGIDPSALIPGTGLCNLPESVELAQQATDLGCEGVIVLPPFYFKDVSEQGLLDYYERFIERVNRTVLRIYLYHIPQVSGVGLSIDLIKTLKDKYPTIIVGIKDSSGDWPHTKQLLLMEDFIVYPGSELPLVEALRLGALGCISATANLNAQQILDVISLCERHDWEQAAVAHDLAVESRLIFQKFAPIPAQKALLAGMTGHEPWRLVRPPLVPMSEQTAKRLKTRLDALVTERKAD
jgi:4-hydroxy-tetrahydrodipicolinate synthase